MVMEGVVLISEKRTPSFIRETLLSFIAQYKDEVRGAAEIDVQLAEEPKADKADPPKAS
jgi:chemotaxis protein MotA